jgi:hypothetical protein
MSSGPEPERKDPISSKQSSSIAFASRGRLDGLRFGLCLDSRGQATASHRTSTRAASHLPPGPWPVANHYRRLRRGICVHSDSLAYRTIGIYVFLRTVMCSPVRASHIAHARKLPRVSVVRRLEELIKHGYVERVGNAYSVTDKVNVPDLQKKLQRRIDLVAETAKRLAEVGARVQ